MTWVIGRAGPFGHAVGLSDIRVTLRNGKEVDCLQKIYNIAPGLALGFAGSVKIGFEVVEQISASLNSKPNVRWNPVYIAEWLPIGTRELFNTFPKKFRDGGCELILLSAHPKDNDGAAPWARCYVYRFRAPEFKPLLANSAEIVSIGSGEKKAKYIKVLQSLENDFGMFKLETGMKGGSALGLMVSVTSAIKKMPTKGISTHLHVCIVGRGETKLGKNDITGQERPKDNFIMPEVATNMEELRELLSHYGMSKSAIEQARC